MAELFKHFGPKVPFGEVQISSSDAELFRTHALLAGTRVHRFKMTDTESTLVAASYATGIITDALADADIPELGCYTKSRASNDPDYWHSKLTLTRFSTKHADTKIYNVYDVESLGGAVTSAVRRVRIVRNLTRLAFDESGEPIEDVYSRQHKAFEAPMVPKDVTTIGRTVDRIVRRQQAMQRLAG